MISYAREDRSFANLLAELLEFHHLPVWVDERALVPGENFHRGIAGAVASTRALLVVVSPASEQSRWVAKEIATFQAVGEDRPVLPLVIGDASPDQVLPGLGDLEAIDFRPALVDGFRRLFSALGLEFLPQHERRESDRRADGERRQAPMRERVRASLWHSYREAQSSDPTSGNIDLASKAARMRTERAFLSGASEYRHIAPDGRSEPPTEALRRALDVVWESFSAIDDRIRADLLIDDLGLQLDRMFGVVAIDRRQEERRVESGS